MRPGQRAAALDAAVAALAGGLALAVYVRSLAPGLLWGDSAEFQFAAWLGGFAHPTGYPLYLMLGWLWSHVVPLGDPAYRMNLFSALWGGVAVALLALLVMRLLRAWSRAPEAIRPWSRAVALCAGCAFAVTSTFWSQAVIAEVYTLHAALLCAILLALAAWAGRVRAEDGAGAWRMALVTAALFGFGLAHHRATLLLIPPALLFGWIVAGSRAASVLRSLRPRRLLLLVACLLAPLLLYLYIPLRAPHVPYFRLDLAPDQSLPLYDASLGGFVAHVTGSVFRSALGIPPDGGAALARLANSFVAEVSPNGILLGLIGLVWLLAGRGEAGRARRAWLALTGSFFVLQIGFNLLYAIGDIHVFYIPAYLVWAVWMAAGAWGLGLSLAALLARLAAGASRWPRALGAAAAVLLLAALAYGSAVTEWPRVQRATDDSAARAWAGLLAAPLPDRAVLVSNDRDEMAPLWYLKYVEGTRPGLDGLFPLLQGGEEWRDVAGVTERGLASGRPVYLVKPMPGLALAFELDEPAAAAPTGRLGPPVHVRGAVAATAPDHPAGSVFGEHLELVGYDLAPTRARPGGVQQVVLYWRVLGPLDRNYVISVQLIGADSAKAGQSDERPGGEFLPMTGWRAGAVLRDARAIAIAPEAAPGTYALLVAIYDGAADPPVYLGEPQTVGSVEVGP